MSRDMKAQLDTCFELSRGFIDSLKPGQRVSKHDLQIFLAKRGVVLSSTARSRLNTMLVDKGLLVQLTNQTLAKPLPVLAKPAEAQSCERSLTDRVTALEGIVADLQKKVADMSNRLL